ncbi:MAG TPA: SMC-Scp complex subunit ScpB [Terriglobales bacterium]|nr:SMC-Scp complex subunit ScpB [Terriglobales bacterium]
MALKGRLEAIIYAAEEPVTLDQLTLLLKESVIQENGLTDREPVAAQSEAKSMIRAALEELTAEYSNSDRGMEVREVAGGYRMATKPEYHDVIRGFAKSLKPPIRLSLQALETLSVIAYKQPVTAPEISEIRGVDSSGVLATLIDKKLITTAGRKQVIGRPMLYKTTKEFLMRFGLKDVGELPSMEEFEKMLGGTQEELFAQPEKSEAAASSSESHNEGAEASPEIQAESPQQEPTSEPTKEVVHENASSDSEQ